MSVQLIQQFYARVDKIIQYGGSRNERVLREAFEDLLGAYGKFRCPRRRVSSICVETIRIIGEMPKA